VGRHHQEPRHRAAVITIFSDLPTPAEASVCMMRPSHGFAQAGNRYPPRIKCEAGFLGVTL
jgi:hypothetical protein